MKILHTSDLHGNWRLPTHYEDFDVWVDTGDFFPNVSRGAPIEKPFQSAWLTKDKLTLRDMVTPALKERYGSEASYWYPRKTRQPPSSGSVAKHLTDWLRGRPMVSVPGNHDYTSLAEGLKRAGAQASDVTRGAAEVGGEVFAGFREVPYMMGEWAGEVHNFVPPVEKTMSASPTVLVTHSPPLGILDRSPHKGGNVGIPYLTSYLAYKPHRIRLHLFGHIHEEPNVAKEMGIIFSNAAQTARVIHLPGGP